MGIASNFKLGSPIDVKLTGLNINQVDYPWWVISVLNWLSMANSLYQANGDYIGYAHKMRSVAKGNYRPEEVYSMYESYVTRLESEANNRPRSKK